MEMPAGVGLKELSPMVGCSAIQKEGEADEEEEEAEEEEEETNKQSKAEVCSRSIAGIAVSNPAEGVGFRLLCWVCVV